MDVIQAAIQQLEQLLEVLNNETQFRFYCSSILIVYDAGSTNANSSSISNRGSGSFCYSVSSTIGNSSNVEGTSPPMAPPDDTTATAAPRAPPAETSESPMCQSRRLADDAETAQVLRRMREFQQSLTAPPQQPPLQQPPLVRVKMVDFAHVVRVHDQRAELQQPTHTHTRAADTSYNYGLKNLILKLHEVVDMASSIMCMKDSSSFIESITNPTGMAGLIELKRCT